MATCNVQTLLNRAQCFACLTPGVLAIIELQLLCEIWQSGGGGGGGAGAVQVSGNPNGVTTGAAALQLGVDPVAQTLWVFEGTPGTNVGWQQFV